MNGKNLSDEEWMEKFIAKDKIDHPEAYLPPITYEDDEDNQESSKKKDLNPIVIAISIIGGIALLVVLFIIFKDDEHAPAEPTEIVIFTDDYSKFFNSDSIRILNKIYRTSCYISPYKFRKPGECCDDYYEMLFYIRNNVVYRCVPYDHQDIVRIYNPRIVGNNLIGDKSRIQVTYRIPDNISISKCSKYAIIDGNIVIEGNPGLTGRIIIFSVCLLILIAYSIFFFRKLEYDSSTGCISGLFLIGIYLFIIAMFIGSIIDLVNYF